MNNKKKMMVTKFTSFGMKFRMTWTESKVWTSGSDTNPWISIFSIKNPETTLTPVQVYEIKETYAEWFNMDVDNLRIKLFENAGKIVIFDLNKVSNVRSDPKTNLISWTYVK